MKKIPFEKNMLNTKERTHWEKAPKLRDRAGGRQVVAARDGGFQEIL